MGERGGGPPQSATEEKIEPGVEVLEQAVGQLGRGVWKELGLRVAGVLPCMQADHSEGCSKRVQAGTFRRQTTWGTSCACPQPLSLDS